jgi:hypothetical protein
VIKLEKKGEKNTHLNNLKKRILQILIGLNGNFRRRDFSEEEKSKTHTSAISEKNLKKIIESS